MVSEVGTSSHLVCFQFNVGWGSIPPLGMVETHVHNSKYTDPHFKKTKKPNAQVAFSLRQSCCFKGTLSCLLSVCRPELDGPQQQVHIQDVQF